MSEGVMLMNREFFWPVILAGILLWAVFIWKEWAQRKEQRFWVKMLASFVSMASLILIVLKPGTWNMSTGGKGIVLTEGYRPSQLDSLKSKYKRIRTEEYVVGQTLSIVEQMDSLFLLGNGLAPFDFWQVEDKSIAFLGGQQPSGWEAISHKNEIPLGESLYVVAHYANPKEGHWAILADNGGNALDSISFDGDSGQVRLQGRPKASGNFVYHLLEKDDKGAIISEEPIPIHVSEGGPLRILMVNTFPTFETKYLKNFLAEKGHEVLVRTQLTKGKYKFEYFNGASHPVYRLTKDILEKYDLLIIDADSYKGLDRTSKEVLESLAKDNGTGVFVQPDECFFKLAQTRSPFRFHRDLATGVDLGSPTRTLQIYPYIFREDIGTQEILMDSTVVGAYVRVGKGKIGTSILQNTYQLVLEGSEGLYATIWTHILNHVAKEQGKKVAWEAVTQIPRPNHPFEFGIRTSSTNLEVMSDDGTHIPLMQDILVPTKWTGIRYPRKPGWNILGVAKDTVPHFSYFVFDENQRTSVSRSETLEANLREFGAQKSFGTPGSLSKKELEPIPLIWFYLLFILSLGWLWLEPKLMG